MDLKTDAGHTVMAMLAAWQIANRAANKLDGRFTDAILVVAPNLTVKDRLEVLKPTVPANYYEKFDLVPAHLRPLLARGRLMVTNWHAFAVADDTGKRGIVQRGRESDAAFVKRVLKELGGAQQILVMNDEAHHAWRPVAPVESDIVKDQLRELGREEKREAEEDVEEATIWVGGLDRINKALGKNGQRGIKFVVDLSATPFALKGSGRAEGEPFPWIVSDFSLVDAIESGITKIPRIPVRDDSGRPDAQYFRLWDTVLSRLAPAERGSGKAQPKPEAIWREAQGALSMLAAKWQTTFNEFAAEGHPVPPAMIVVASNTDIAKAFAEGIANGDVLEALKGDVTFQIDSKALKEAELGEGASRKEHEVMLRLKTATVGKHEWEGGGLPPSVQNLDDKTRAALAVPPGKDVRCVVSVGMLTEGWDAQNVTQILGLRAFRSQLLCEQVVGRALRRMRYDFSDDGMLQPEYADIFGVPFEVIPVQGTGTAPPAPLKPSTLVQALDTPDRKRLAIEFPRVEGYVKDVRQRVTVDVDGMPQIKVDASIEVMQTTVAPQMPVAEGDKLQTATNDTETLRRDVWLQEHRLQRTAFEITAKVVRALRPVAHGGVANDDDGDRGHLFAQLLPKVEQYLDERVATVGEARREEVALPKYQDAIVARFLDAIEAVDDDDPPIRPRIERYRPTGTTADVLFRTTKPAQPTKRSHVSHVTFDSTFEGQAAFFLERDDLGDVVDAYVKNDRLDFTIPYERDGARSYIPDFIVRIKLDDGSEGLSPTPLFAHVILETKGWVTEDAKLKESAALKWIRAVNADGTWGRWDYRIVTEPAEIPQVLRALAGREAFEKAPIPQAPSADDAAEIKVPATPASSPTTPSATSTSDWVAASRTRNFLLRDPLLDWLDLYGESRGFVRDDRVEGYDEATDFNRFILRKSKDFETRVIDLLRRELDGQGVVETVAVSPSDVKDPAAAARTIDAMKRGVAVIAQGVLHDDVSRTYGAPDLLVRSDVLASLFPGVFDPDHAWFVDRFGAEPGTDIASFDAPGLGQPWHYRVVDVKLTTLHLLKDGALSNEGSARAYKAQLFLYNRALGRAQGYQPVSSFLLGRGWSQGSARGSSCLERLAPVFQDAVLGKDERLSDVVDAAVRWIRLCRTAGASWEATPTPSKDELRPNMKNTLDSPWHRAKKRIADDVKDLTLVWQVGVEKRDLLLQREPPIRRWDDPAFTPEVAKIGGAKTKPVLEALLRVHRDPTLGPVQPSKISNVASEWRNVGAVEFFVDFETVSDLNDDFSALPEKGGQPLIYMVGCGHFDVEGAWKFSCFVVDDLSEAAEATMLDRWFTHMESVKAAAGFVGEPRVFHWSPAEVSTLETAYNSAKERHRDGAGRSWPVPQWFDFLNRVVKAEPVVVRGAMGFGLKAFGKALHALGKVETKWSDGPTDGLGAMVAAWSAASAAPQGMRLSDQQIMKDAIKYNEVDCRVMGEIIRYLRSAH